MEKINGNRSVTSLRGGLRARAQGSLGLVLHVNNRSTAVTERATCDRFASKMQSVPLCTLAPLFF